VYDAGIFFAIVKWGVRLFVKTLIYYCITRISLSWSPRATCFVHPDPILIISLYNSRRVSILVLSLWVLHQVHCARYVRAVLGTSFLRCRHLRLLVCVFAFLPGVDAFPAGRWFNSLCAVCLVADNPDDHCAFSFHCYSILTTICR